MANLDALLRIKTDVQGANQIVALNRGLQGVERTAAGASVAMRGLQASLGGVIGLVGGATIMSKIFGDTAILQTQTRSLEVLLGSAAKASQIVKELQAYGSVTPFESTELIETAKRLGAFGIAGQRVVEVTKRLGDVAGATGSNLGELATAYGQVVAKGRLQTEELLQFQERGVGIQGELQRMYNLSGQELQKALSDGRVSSEAFEQAIVRLTDKGGKYANGAIAQSDTLNGRLSTLRDTVTSLSQTIGGALEPALSRILLIATNTVDTINRAMRAALLGPQNADTIAQVNAGQLPFGTAGVDKLIGEQRRRALQGQSAGFLGMMDQGKFLRLLQQQPEFRSPTGTGGRAAPLVVPPLTSGTRAAGGGETKITIITGGFTGGGQSGPSRGRSSGPHLHAQRVSGAGVNQMVAAALEFPGGRTALDPIYGERRRPGYHDGYRGNDYGTPQGTPFKLRPGWTGADMGVLGALGRGMRVSGPGGVFELGHLAGISTGQVGKSQLQRGGGIDGQMAWRDSIADAEAKAKKDAEERKQKEKEAAEQTAKQLTAARDLLTTNEAALRVAEATTPLQRLSAEYDQERARRMGDYADKLQGARSDLEREALVAAQVADIRRAEIGYQEKLKDITTQRIAAEREGADALAESMARLEEFTSRSSAGAGFKQGLQGYVDEIGNMRDAVGQLTTKSIGGLEDSLTELATTGTTNFKAFAASVLQETSRMIIRQVVLGTIMQAIGGILTPSQGGYGFASPRSLGSYAGGGYTGDGARSGGLDGQGGFMAMLHPRETVIDHTRGTPRTGTAGGNAITINVDASGTKAEGNAGTGAALARDLARVVDDRLIHHRRPGGLLAA
jgi:lambda family phage tail tape measure protein